MTMLNSLAKLSLTMTLYLKCHRRTVRVYNNLRWPRRLLEVLIASSFHKQLIHLNSTLIMSFFLSPHFQRAVISRLQLFIRVKERGSWGGEGNLIGHGDQLSRENATVPFLYSLFVNYLFWGASCSLQ